MARSNGSQVRPNPSLKVWCANGILESNVAVAVFKNLTQSGTTRNASTVEKIQTMMQGAD